MQLLVTGVVLGTTGCTEMRWGDLRLLDVITQVNQQPVCNLQKSFDDATRELASVSLLLDRSISLPSISELISDGQSRLICMHQLLLSDNTAIFWLYCKVCIKCQPPVHDKVLFQGWKEVYKGPPITKVLSSCVNLVQPFVLGFAFRKANWSKVSASVCFHC